VVSVRDLGPLETTSAAAYNEAHRREDCVDPCGAREILWPMDAVLDDARDRVLVFYVKIHGEPGDWNFHPLGYGVAVWEDPELPPIRPEVNPDSAEPTLLFRRERHNFGDAALIAGGKLYAYACGDDGTGWDKPCLLGRVAPEDVLLREQWRFWDGEGWSREVDRPEPVFDGNSQLSVHYNPFLDRFLAVHVDGISDELVLRTAPSPEDPWSRMEEAFEAKPDAGGGWVYCGLAHDELMGEEGRFEYLSYFRGTGDWQGEIRLVEVELGRP
jgi:hypothetical protein